MSNSEPLTVRWQEASWLSRISMHYLTRLVTRSWKHQLSDQDIGTVASSMSYSTAGAKWDELVEKGCSPAWIMIRAHVKTILLGVLLGLVTSGLQIFIAVGLFFSLATFLADPSQKLGWGIGLALLMLLANVLMNFVFANCWIVASHVGVAAKAGFSATAFRKSIRLRNFEGNSVGRILNLLSNDSDRMWEAGLFIVWNLVAPVHVSVILVLIGVFLGWPGALVTPIVLVSMIVSRVNGIAIGKLRHAILKFTDFRVTLVSELVESVKLVKSLASEDHFTGKVSDVRRREIRQLERTAVLSNFSATFVQATAIVSVLLAIVVRLAVELPLSSATAFTLLTLVAQLWFPLHLFSLGLPKQSTAYQSCIRLFALLAEPEIETAVTRVGAGGKGPLLSLKDVSIRHYGVEADKNQAGKEGKSDLISLSKSGDSPFELRVGSLDFESGLHMIVGAVGTGKSTLLLGVLGQLGISPESEITICGSVAYAPQLPFIMNATVRDNVLFGLDFDDERYRTAVCDACLDVDVMGFTDRDLTEIGERGVNLSGGQRQRVSLAHAFYSNSDVLLLDDCLSAVDVTVGKKLFRALKQKATAGKMVILVNHQLQFSSDADRIIVLAESSALDSANSEVAQVGTYETLSEIQGPFSEMLKNYVIEDDEENVDSASDDGENVGTSKAVLLWAAEDQKDSETKVAEIFVASEKMEMGQIEKRVWSQYGRMLGTKGIASFIGLVFYQGLRAFADFWLALYLQESILLKFEVWAGLWGLYSALAILVFLLSEVMLYRATLGAARKLHDVVFANLLKGSMTFFDTTPVGRITNRFSRDIDIVDSLMPFAVEQLFIYFLQSLSMFVSVAVVYPLILVTFPPAFCLFIIIGAGFRSASRQTKRMWGMSKSHVFSILQTVFGGISTIRATELGIGAFATKFETRVNMEQSLMLANWTLGRFLNLRLDLIVSFLVFFVALIAVTSASSSAAVGALAISYTIRLGK